MNIQTIRYTLNLLLILNLFYTLPLVSMEPDYIALEATEYNSNLLAQLPQEVWLTIFSHCIIDTHHREISLEKGIKNGIHINATCRYFKTLLPYEKIITICKDTQRWNKNDALRGMVFSIYGMNRAYKRLSAILLILAGANASIEGNNLLKEAVLASDAEFTDLLLKHKAEPYVHINKSGYISYHAKTAQLVEVFILNKVNIHATGAYFWNDTRNVLWHIICEDSFQNTYSADLMKTYLSHGVDAKVYDSHGRCLLHHIAQHTYVDDSKNFLEKARIVLDTIPEMINTVCNYNYTPLDNAYNTLEWLQKHQNPDSKCCKVFEELIALYQEYGALTSAKVKCKILYKWIKKNLSMYVSIEPEAITLVQTYLKQEKIKKDTIWGALAFICLRNNSMLMRIILAALENQAQEVILYCGNDYYTLLHGACQHRLSEIPKILIDTLGDASDYVCRQNNRNETSLILAIKQNNNDVAQLLMHAAGKRLWDLLRVQDKKGNTALIYAVRNGHIDSIEALIIAANDHAHEYIGIQNNSGYTAFDCAVDRNNKAAITLFNKL